MNYTQKANPNATNSELDAKKIITHTFSKHELETILYSLEGYIQGNDDIELVEELVNICYKLEAKLNVDPLTHKVTYNRETNEYKVEVK
tara:strand:+ start:2573 stop:2839 length:267 start_codon:yes stop_codon:yes gene_type:complete